MTLRRSLLAVIAITFLACGSAAARPDRKDKLRVLFIGNSLTYVNDVPAIVAAFAKATKQNQLAYKTVAYPNYSLEDHWVKGDARKTIAKGGWDVVVLQQGPSSLGESRVLLREYVRRFAEEIRRVGARPAVYMVWPFANSQKYFDAVVEAHRLAAEDVDGILLPVGEAWRAVIKLDRRISLYGEDGFHPSTLGSFLAAWIIFERLYGASFEMPAKLSIDSDVIQRIKLKPSEIEVLRTAVKGLAASSASVQ